MIKKILVICGHPDIESFTGLVAKHYAAAATEAGHDVTQVNVGELEFDPVLRKGYNEEQLLESDLVVVQEAIKNSDHLVIVYPNWWCAMPAILKGLFDRIWLSGFAFINRADTNKTDRLLAGRTARVIILSGSYHPFMAWWNYGDYTNEIQYAILEFAGIRTNVTSLGPVQKVSDKKRQSWLREVEQLGKRGI